MRPADLWLLAVSDTQIEAVAKALSHLPLPAATAWHCSGFWPAAALGALQQRGWQTASAHPALSFAEAARASTPEPREQFAGTLCALEGDGEAVAWAEASFSAIGGRCFRLSAEDKPLYHAAAVLASNFQPVLQAAAVKLWQRCGLPEDQIGPLWRGFVQKGCDNLMRAEPAAVLTGPAARGDDAVVRAETEALRTVDPALAQAYEALSVLARRLALSADQRADQSAD
jgi:predicted short-subunit dehydrogenase-like oxidoreductase (DUF2520 family)